MSSSAGKRGTKRSTSSSSYSSSSSSSSSSVRAAHGQDSASVSEYGATTSATTSSASIGVKAPQNRLPKRKFNAKQRTRSDVAGNSTQDSNRKRKSGSRDIIIVNDDDDAAASVEESCDSLISSMRATVDKGGTGVILQGLRPNPIIFLPMISPGPITKSQQSLRSPPALSFKDAPLAYSVLRKMATNGLKSLSVIDCELNIEGLRAFEDDHSDKAVLKSEGEERNEKSWKKLRTSNTISYLNEYDDLKEKENVLQPKISNNCSVPGYVKASSFITELDISKNKLGPAGLKMLADVFKSNQDIEKLNISENEAVGVNMKFGRFQGNYDVTGLEDFVGSLVRCKDTIGLKHLDLSRNYLAGYSSDDIESQHTTSLCSCMKALFLLMDEPECTLTTIAVYGNHFSVEESTTLSHFIDTALESRNSQLSFYGSVPFIKDSKIASNGMLNLQGCGLYEDDFSFLPAHINCWNHHLTTFDFSYNLGLGVSGLNQLCLALSSLNFPNQVHVLNLRGVVDSSGSERGEEYNKALSSIIHLSNSTCLSWQVDPRNSNSKTSSMRQLKPYKGVIITCLDVSGNVGLFGPTDVEYGGQNRPISFMHFTDAVNGSAYTLDSLNMSCCGIIGAKCLSFVNAPTILDASYNPGIGCLGTYEFLALFHSKTLKTLRLRGNRLGRLGITTIQDEYNTENTIEILDLSCNIMCGLRNMNEFDPSSFTIFCSNLNTTNVTTLVFSNSDIGARSMRALFELLKQTPKIHTLECNNCNLNEEGGMHIAAALPQVVGLVNLSVSNCKFGADASEAILNGLKINKSVKKLDISSNILCCNFDAEIYEYELKALTALRRCLETNVVVEDIDLSDNGLFGYPLKSASLLPNGLGGAFQVDAVTELCVALHANAKAGGKLSVLNILKNRMEPCASPYSHGPVKSLETKMRTRYDRSFARTVGIDNEFWEQENSMRPRIHPHHMVCTRCRGTQKLKEILQFAEKSNVALCGIRKGQTSVDLRSHHIMDQEVPLVAHDIMRTASLKSVDLTDNPFGDFGKLIIAEVIRENITLKSVRVFQEPWARCQRSRMIKYDKIHEAKVHAYKYRKAICIFLKEFGVDTIPTRLIFEFLFGYTHVELESVNAAFRLK